MTHDKQTGCLILDGHTLQEVANVILSEMEELPSDIFDSSTEGGYYCKPQEKRSRVLIGDEYVTLNYQAQAGYTVIDTGYENHYDTTGRLVHRERAIYAEFDIDTAIEVMNEMYIDDEEVSEQSIRALNQIFQAKAVYYRNLNFLD